MKQPIIVLTASKSACAGYFEKSWCRVAPATPKISSQYQNSAICDPCFQTIFPFIFRFRFPFFCAVFRVFWLQLLSSSKMPFILHSPKAFQGLSVCSKFELINLCRSGVMLVSLCVNFQDWETWAKLETRKIQNPYF